MDKQKNICCFCHSTSEMNTSDQMVDAEYNTNYTHNIHYYRVSQRKRFFVAASYWDWIFSNTDNLWLILFPDMGDFVPNRNFDQKSTQSPTNWLNSQMSKLWMLAIFDQNSRKKLISSQILDEIFVFWKKYCVQWIPQILRFSKMSLMCSLSHLELIWSEFWELCYGKFLWVWKYSWFWHLTGKSMCWLLIKVSVRYKIAHVWEENES